MYEYYSRYNQSTVVLTVLAIILFSGFLFTRFSKMMKLPNVSGYIFAGIIIGPCVLNAIPPSVIKNMGFVSDLALAFIAFGVGRFFKKEVLRETGSKVIVITLAESLIAGMVICVSMRFFLRLDWMLSLILGAIAMATAPASTMMTINQYKAKGEFVNVLLQVVALDDVVCLLGFSAVMVIANSSGKLSAIEVILPIFLNIAAMFMGFVCGFILTKLLTPARSKDNRLILALAMLLTISGICAIFDVSPLLSCMVFGATYINLTKDKNLFKQVNNFIPPIMSIFFIVSGMSLDLKVLSTVGSVGVCYFFLRIVGKYLGAYLGCIFVGTSNEIRDYLGIALIPQAGVAIGLAFLGQRILKPELGSVMLTIILSSSVLYEIIGPASAKLALFWSGAIPKGQKIETEKIADDATSDF